MNLKEKYSVGAVILAAGQSKRMGRNKMLLPFDRSTVIATIVSEVTSTSVDEAIVVTGYEADKIEAALTAYPVRCVFNPDYAQAEMLVSMQMGLRSMSEHQQAVLMVLGDQPRIRHEAVQRVIDAGAPGALVIPSYQRRRGHPILIDRAFWPEILALPPDSILRDFIRLHADRIRHVEIDSDSVLHDVDTPQDYQALIHDKTHGNTAIE